MVQLRDLAVVLDYLRQLLNEIALLIYNVSECQVTLDEFTWEQAAYQLGVLVDIQRRAVSQVEGLPLYERVASFLIELHLLPVNLLVA